MASVIVRKSDNTIRDASAGEINYNPIEYINLHPDTNPIPQGENPKKYYRDANGDIVKRPAAELLAEFSDEQVATTKAKWITLRDSIPGSAAWKGPLIELAKILGWE